MTRIKIDLPTEFVFSTNIPIRISDINRGNHLGHDAILPMVEEARVRFLSSLGYKENNICGASFIVVDAGIIYRKQGYYGQTLKLEIAITDLAVKGCDMVCRISDVDTGHEIARAKTGLLFYNYHRQKIVNVPDEFRKKISS